MYAKELLILALPKTLSNILLIYQPAEQVSWCHCWCHCWCHSRIACSSSQYTGSRNKMYIIEPYYAWKQWIFLFDKEFTMSSEFACHPAIKQATFLQRRRVRMFSIVKVSLFDRVWQSSDLISSESENLPERTQVGGNVINPLSLTILKDTA